MRIAYLDTIAGIAGDMTMAAFVSAGLPLEELTAAVAQLGLDGVELSARHVQRSAIDAVQIEVTVTHTPHYHRHLKDILALIDASALSPGVKERAGAIFRIIAEAEAKIHATTVDRIHFHEVGAIDSIVDIVGTAICIEKMGVERLYSSPVRLGSGGFITTQHGTMPTPAPASLEILKGYPTVLTTIPHELTTPTGAAIVKTLSSGVLDEETIMVETVGYGAGTKEIAEIPNLLRLVIGDMVDPTLQREQILVVETNIDDMNPQVYPFLIEELLAAGAHDAYLVPVIMKKGRPGILLSTMVARHRLDTITEIIYRHSSTIGLRIQAIGRRKLPRRTLEVETSLGKVKAKAVTRGEQELILPEFEECKRIAREQGRSVLDVMRILEQEIARETGTGPHR